MATPNYTGSFKSAVNRGTPAWQAVNNIASKNNKTETWVWNHLFKNGAVDRRKLNGKWIYWANWTPGKNARGSHHKGWNWQHIINWAISSGYCTHEQISGLKSQKDFFNFFGPFFSQQFGWNVSSGWTKTQVKNWKGNGSTSKTTGSKSKTTGRRSSSKKRSTGTKTHGRKKSTKRTTTRGRKSTTSARSYKFPKSNTRRASYRRAA